MASTPYPYQECVGEYLLSGQNVILQAPTGAGKTAAAIVPFLHAVRYDQHDALPPRCLYSVPMRILADQFEAEYGKQLQHFMNRWGWEPERRIRVKIQTGERPDDRELAGNLIFATIDQTLSSFLHQPYSLPKRLWNQNAGAVASSYLVFDEFHLFDPISTLPTTLEMLTILKDVAPMLLMTATFSSNMLEALADLLGAVVVPESEEERDEMLNIPIQRDRQRFYHLADGPLSAEAVLRAHQQRSLVVCNVVDRARQLYQELRNHPGRGETRILLVHSRFLREDRRRIEAELLRWFGKDGEAEDSIIAVATQAIEVGLDISADALHTELAPANAVFQRAGRCARYGGEGHVYIYPRVREAEGEVVDLTEHVLPYKGQEPEFERTLSGLRERDGAQMDFRAEQVLINRVHGPRDEAILRGLCQTREEHRARMNAVIAGWADRGEGRNLIRQIASRPLVIHNKPLALLEHPFAAEAFSMYPGSLYGMVKRWLERAEELDLDWAVKALVEIQDYTDSSRGTAYDWLNVQEAQDIRGTSLVVVNPSLAGYQPDTGFLPDKPTGFRSPVPGWEDQRREWRKFLMLEPYAEHVRLVWQAFEREWPALAPTAARLEQREGWTAGIVTRAAAMVTVLHDVGKLTGKRGGRWGWQTWARQWQRAVGCPMPEGFLAAHTDYDSDNPLHLQKEHKLNGKRPAHALEGAVAVVPLLVTVLGEAPSLLKAAFSAIARHHAPHTEQWQAYRLLKQAPEAVAETLVLLPVEFRHRLEAGMLRMEDDPYRTSVSGFFLDPSTPDGDAQLVAYALLARALRRADRGGTKKGTEWSGKEK